MKAGGKKCSRFPEAMRYFNCAKSECPKTSADLPLCTMILLNAGQFSLSVCVFQKAKEKCITIFKDEELPTSVLPHF